MNNTDVGRLCTLADVQMLSRTVQEFWGAHLYVKVVPDVTPCMDWREVLLPPEVTTWSRAKLTSTLLHEWGHRMISPISPGRGAIWRKVAERAGASQSQAQLVVNAATDAWLDRHYLEDTTWGQVYHEGESESIEDLEKRLLKKDAATAPMTPFMRLWAGFYRKLLATVGNNAGDQPAAAERLVLSTEERSCIDDMWRVLYEGGSREDERVRQLARLLRERLPEDDQGELRTFPRLHPFSGKERGSRGLTERLRREAHAAGLDDRDLAEVFDREQLDELRRQAARLHLYARVVPIVKRFLSERARRAFSGYHSWQVGRPLRELDLTATIQHSSLLVPGVTTLARHFERRGFHHGPGSGGVILIIDDSGSTDGKVLLREKEAAFAVVAAARSFGDPVGCVVFGSEVTATLEPTTRYGAVEELVFGLSSDSGGTEIRTALQAARNLTKGQIEFTLMVMTDAEISDPEELAQFVRMLPATARMIAFCFNAQEQVQNTLGPLASQRFRLLAASPREPFAEAALEEVYG